MRKLFLLGLLSLGSSFSVGQNLENGIHKASAITQAAKEQQAAKEASEKRDFFDKLKQIVAGKTMVMEVLTVLHAPQSVTPGPNGTLILTYFPPHMGSNNGVMDAYYHIQLDSHGKVVNVTPDGGP